MTQQEDYERINNGDFQLGIGVVVSEVVQDLLDLQNSDKENVVTFCPLSEEEEQPFFEGKLKDIQTICQNEKSDFLHSLIVLAPCEPLLPVQRHKPCLITCLPSRACLQFEAL